MVAPPAGEPGESLGVQGMMSGSGLLSYYEVGNQIILWKTALVRPNVFIFSFPTSYYGDLP